MGSSPGDAKDPRKLLFGVGAAMLAVGFLAGYAVATDQQSRGGAATAPAAPFANGAGAMGAAPMGGAPMAGGAGPMMGGGADGSGGLAPAVLPPPHMGHTFTGDINVPPHSEAAHELANVLLKDIPCPCGGCQHMTLGECTCDTAQEVGGYAAHLLERGKRGDEVLAQLQPRYNLQLTDAVRATAAKITLANGAPPEAVGGAQEAMNGVAPATEGGGNPLAALATLAGKGGNVQRLVDVPTSARPGSEAATAGLASTVLDPAQFTGSIAESYAIARRIPEVLQQLPCGCGCMSKLGHANLLTCYQSTHASTCPICQKEAHEAAALAQAGTSVADIRAKISAEFPSGM